jgi:uncharacterized protein YbcI
MDETQVRPNDVAVDGRLSAAISNSVVRILHEYTGRGPTKARTTIDHDLVVTLLAQSMTKGEQALNADGRGSAVLALRVEYQATMERELVAAVEGHTGRRVMAFMSSNHLEPDLAAELFVLEPHVAAADGHPLTEGSS